MLFVPLPFVVALLFFMLLVWTWRNQDEARINRPFLALLALAGLQSVVLGLRWGYDIEPMRYVLPVLASCVPPLVYESFCALMHRTPHGGNRSRSIGLALPLIMIGIVIFAPMLIDFTLICIFLVYALALVLLGRTGPDGFDEARFESAGAAHRALYVAAASLCLSAGFDFIIWSGFAWAAGERMKFIVGNTNLLSLVLIGITAHIASDAKAEAGPVAEAEFDQALSEQDRELLQRVEKLLVGSKLYCDENLTLTRLARRLSVPARQISGAVNRLTNRNVSQFINDFRIGEACRLLRETDQPVTMVMFESGFQTKSNFNREFRRVTGLSPANWRRQAQEGQTLS